MPEGGELAIGLMSDGAVARITVRDSGPGIPPEVMRSIYEMHFTTKSGGTGVGLFVARAVVQSHGGTIEVLSAPERGTAFTLTLPIST